MGLTELKSIICRWVAPAGDGLGYDGLRCSVFFLAAPCEYYKALRGIILIFRRIYVVCRDGFHIHPPFAAGYRFRYLDLVRSSAGDHAGSPLLPHGN